MRTLLAIVPTAGVLFLFWLAIRAMIQADRRERLAQARWEAAERARSGPDGGGTESDAGRTDSRQ